MPSHYVYDETKKDGLSQGDVLERGEALDPILKEYFPYYFLHKDYRYFMVMTQSCELVRRDGPCKSPYITLAAVRPIKDLLLLEADKLLLEPELRAANVLGSAARDKLALFLASLMDNNKPGYFYLHTDATVGITEPSCAFLQLAISFRSVHYDKCLLAKIAQPKEFFQAKLGWLIGSMYSQVGTTEWDSQKKDEKVAVVASRILNGIFVTQGDDRMRAALPGLRALKANREKQAAEAADGSQIEDMTAEEIREFIRRQKVVPGLKQFKDQASQTMAGLKIIDPVMNKLEPVLMRDEELKLGIEALFAGDDAREASVKAAEAIRKVVGKMREFASDRTFPDKEKIYSYSCERANGGYGVEEPDQITVTQS